MGVPVLFTDASTPDLIVVPFPGLFLSDELFLGDDVFLDDGPTLDFYATPPAVTSFGVTVSVTPVAVTFDATAPTLIGVTDVTVAVFPVEVTFDATAPDVAGQDLVVSVDAGVVTFSATTPDSSGGQLLILVPSVRELPPLRLHHLIRTPSGRHFRWGEDDPNPINVPSGVRFSDTMPGGFETADATLPRKSSDDSRDLERLSTWTIAGAGGEVAWEGRTERAPRTSGDEVSVSPSGVGYQAHLDDDKSVEMVYVDGDMSAWRGPSAQRRLQLDAANFSTSDVSVDADEAAGTPQLRLEIDGAWAAPRKPVVEAWYDGGRYGVAGIYITPSYGTQVGLVAQWLLQLAVSQGDGSGPAVFSGQQFPITNQILFSSQAGYRYAFIQWLFNVTPAGADGAEYAALLHNVRVVGNHGLPTAQDPLGNVGVLASTVVAHAVRSWAPQLRVSEGPTGSVRPSSFVISQLAFKDRTTTSEIVKQATRFGLQDWAVWDNQTFWWHDRGATGRKWRARVGPADLQETGQAVDRVWESVIVQFNDVDGSTKTAGPPGSGADVEDPVLKDADPTNPANEAGIVRRDLLQMGTSTAAAATEVGRRFLEESKVLDGSGQARFVGHVEDDRGVVHPYWAPRAGDTVVFVDAADSSPRRLVRTEKDHGSRTCTVDLDAPPEGLQALLERLGVVLVPLGF